MKRVLIGTIIAGLILAFFSERSTPSCVLAGFFATMLVLQLGPRSIVEKVGALLCAAAIAWLAGPMAATRHQSALWYFAAWTFAGTALAAYLHPRTE